MNTTNKSYLLRNFLNIYSKEKGVTNHMRIIIQFLLSNDALDNYVMMSLKEFTGATKIKISSLTISLRNLVNLSILDKSKLKNNSAYKINTQYISPIKNIPHIDIDQEKDFNQIKQNLSVIYKDASLKCSSRLLLEYLYSFCIFEQWSQLDQPKQIISDLEMYNSTYHSSRASLIKKKYIKVESGKKYQKFFIPLLKVVDNQ